uniref:SFRICE_000198 n=1 Tax=Spodoptera frugiperda TaxID=7108 RepID=A0A2H1W080_SPOFR
MSGRPRTTSFAEGSKSVRKTFDNQPPKPPLGGVKISNNQVLTEKYCLTNLIPSKNEFAMIMMLKIAK